MVLAQIHCVTPAVPKGIRAIITSTTQAGRAPFAHAQEADVLSSTCYFNIAAVQRSAAIKFCQMLIF